MRILFISNELIGSGLCHRLKKEGHDIKLYIHDSTRKDCLTGFFNKTSNWKEELKWVGKQGLIIFDDVGFGKVQESLRKKGYIVLGGNIEADKLELDRAYGQRILHTYGIKILPSFNFKNIDGAIDFVRENKGKWAVKQTSHISSLNFVGEKIDGSDVIERLQMYKKLKIPSAHLQKKADGIEVGIARYFNGREWVGPIEINHEHKRLLNDDKGPLTAEMGTVMWHTTNEAMPLYVNTLKKITPFLQKIQFQGDIDLNCIVTEKDIWPLELTPRLGTPAIQLQCELFESSFGDFLLNVATGKNAQMNYKDGYGIVASVSVPPFPYPPHRKKSSKKTIVSFTQHLTEKDSNSIFLEEVSQETTKNGQQLYWAGEFGYLAYVVATAKNITIAQKRIHKLLSLISVRNKIFRTDIGTRVRKHDIPLLKKWGWIV